MTEQNKTEDTAATEQPPTTESVATSQESMVKKIRRTNPDMMVKKTPAGTQMYNGRTKHKLLFSLMDRLKTDTPK